MSERKNVPRLGRGLASLLGDDHPSDKDVGDRRSLPVANLVPGPFQPRQDMPDDALEELAASIRMHGVLQPILVRPDPSQPDRFQIIAGERRWRAAQKAGLHDVPVHIRILDDAASLAAALIENLQRQDLNAIEEAEGLRRLATEFAMTQEAVASSIGKSRSHVANTIRLLSLPASVQFDVRRGALSAGHARALLGHPEPVKAANAVLSRGLNVRQTEALSKPTSRQNEPAMRSRPEHDVEAVERELTHHLGLRVTVRFQGDRGEIRLPFSGLDQFDGLVRLLKGGQG